MFYKLTLMIDSDLGTVPKVQEKRQELNALYNSKHDRVGKVIY